jgi:minor extracellular serine protease Vpr
MSFGSAVSRKEDPLLLETIANAVAGGMVVVVSAGNSGPGRNTIETPGISEPAITVASTTNGHTFGTAVRVSGPAPVPSVLENIAVRPGLPPVRVLPTAVLHYADVAAIPDGRRACRRLRGSLAGEVGLVERGGCSFRRKLRNMTAAGAVAAIVYNVHGGRRDGGDALVDMIVAGAEIPSVFVGRTGGLALRERVGAVPDSRLRFDGSDEQPLSTDVVSDFSSRGTTRFGQLKPDLSAPGEAIYGGAITTAPIANGVADAIGFAAASGTSQAAAHVTGAAALLRNLHPMWTPEQVKSALMATAVPSRPRRVRRAYSMAERDGSTCDGRPPCP